MGSAQAAPDTDNVATAVIEQDAGRAFDFAWDLDNEQGDADVTAPELGHGPSPLHGLPGHRDRLPDRDRRRLADHGGPARTWRRRSTSSAPSASAAAEARQFVRVVPDPVQFTGTGRAVLDDVREDLAALETQDLPLDQLHQAVEMQEARVRQVLQDELVLKSDPSTQTDVLEERDAPGRRPGLMGRS